MDDTQKMLQAIINGQVSFKGELSRKIDKLDSKLGGRIDGLGGRIDQVEKNLIERLDKIGKQLAYLEDDSPTREEIDKLEKKVDKIEQRVISI